MNLRFAFFLHLFLSEFSKTVSFPTGGERGEGSGIEAELTVIGWEAQAKAARHAGIKPSYMNDIPNKRKKATEETRRTIACVLDTTYEGLLEKGRKILAEPEIPVTE